MTLFQTAAARVICAITFALMPAFLWAQPAPSLVFPKQSIVTGTASVAFQWDVFPGAVSYQIQADDDNLFNSPALNDPAVSGTSRTATLVSGKYYWRVRATTNSGQTNWSATWIFTIFSPQDVNVTTWYRASAAHVDGSGFVDTLYDATINNNHATQSTATKRPLYVAALPEINNQPVLRFDGANDFVTFRTPLTSIETVFWVINESVSATNKYRSILGDMNQEPNFHRGCCDGGFPGPTRYLYDDDYSSPNVRNGVTRINGTVVPSTSTNVPTSMSIISTRTAGNAKAENFSNDRDYDGGGRVWWGDLAELVIFNDALDTNQINLVTEYLRYKYAPPVNLGANVIHPYRLCDNIALSLNYYKSYAWSTGSTASSITVTAPGTYSVTVTDQFNRVSRDTVTVQFVRPNVVQASTICIGDSVVWDTGLSNDYGFLWSDGSTGSRNVIKTEGDYWVQITDSFGCMYQTPAVHFDLDSFTAIADLGNDTLLCLGQSIGLVSGANLATSYLWNTGSTSPTINITITGTYSLTVSDALGCTKIDSIYVDVGANAPVTNFSAPSVCFGLATAFTNLSVIDTPNVITDYQWNFGDNTFDTLANPLHAYSAPGTYQVTLTAYADNLCINSVTKSVQVHDLPSAQFSDSVACVNGFMQFDDATLPASGTVITSWLWNFDDNSISNQQNPVHQFDSVKVYHVSLSVTDSRGCADAFIRDVSSVVPVPPADAPELVYPKDNVTLSEDSIVFIWQKSNRALTYILQVSTNPVFTNVVKTVAAGDTISAVVSGLALGNLYYWRVRAVNLCGDLTNSEVYRFNYLLPSSVPGLCLWLSADHGVTLDINGAVEAWVDRSSSHNDAQQTNGLRRPTQVAGIAELNGLPALHFEGQSNEDQYVAFNKISTVRTVFWVVREDSNATPSYRSLLGVKNDASDFHRGCCTGSYPGPDKYIYDGDFAATEVITGVTKVNSVVVDPLLTDVPTRYSIISTKTTGDTEAECFSCDLRYPLDHRFWWGDLAELVIYCQPLTDSLVNVVEEYLADKYAPPVNLGSDIVLSYGVCTPTTLNAGSRFTRYRWSTGDTTASVQVFGQGTYSVIVTDIFGRTSFDEVTITGGLNTVTYGDTLFICNGDSLVWNTGLNHDYIFEWQDGSADSFYVLKDPGAYWVKVSDTFGCSVTSDTVVVQIDSFSVYASLGADTNLCSGNRIGLLVGSESAIAYTWSDGTTQPELTVQASGDYSVTVENVNQCFAFDTIHVNIIGAAPDADFSFNTTCHNDTTFFTDLTTPPAVDSWLWNFGDGGSDTIQNVSHFYNNPGTYQVTLLVQDAAGCAQSITKPVVVYSLPAASFTHDLTNCANDNVRFHDASSVGAGQTIVSWQWSFGDSGSSNVANPSHAYPAQGIYDISLQVATDRGCVNTAYDTMEVFPALNAAISVGNLCFDYPVDFYDATPTHSNISWYWNFGDRNSSTQKNPVYNYLNPGTYVVSLDVKNAIGCRSTATDTISVTSRPTVDFDTPALCENAAYQFSDNTVINGGDNTTAWTWNFGDQSPLAHTQNPVHTYANAATYNVTLTVHTQNGCENFKTKQVTVVNPPDAAFTFTPDYGAAPLTVHFTNQSQNAASYLWDFGDSSPLSTEIHPEHTYQQNDTVRIVLIASNLPGCSDTADAAMNISAATLDIALDDIILEKSPDGDCSYLLKMGAYVLNIGTREVTSFDILASSSNGGAIVEHWEGDFINRQITYPFNADFRINDCDDDVVVCMEVKNPNGGQDENPLNNRACVTLSSELIVIGPSPNPTGDFVNLDILTPSRGDLRIRNYNAIGLDLGEIKQAQLDKGYHQIHLDVTHLSQGVYLLKIEFNEESRVLKFTKR